MAIVATADVLESALWPRGDARDPLGIWGARGGVTGDASGGSTKITIQVPAGRKSAFVYTVYAVNPTILNGTNVATTTKVRLLTNWPNIDPQAGVQAFSRLRLGNLNGALAFTDPQLGPFLTDFLQPNDRFILLYDPRPIGGAMSIIEFEMDRNILAEVSSFEAYGYYWDRNVMATPGGPRHPGAS